MSECFLGEVRLAGFNYAPLGWAACNGAVISIAENSALYNLIGTIYGGDGQATFGLPDLRGRIPIHQGNLAGGGNYVIGQVGGVETVTVTPNQIAAHNHLLMASSAVASSNTPGNQTAGDVGIYSNRAPNKSMNPGMVSPAQGGNLPHDNMQPYLALNWIIAMVGVYPTQG
jgi:microcystin-dependent protein